MKQKQFVGDEQVPSALQTEIIVRFLKGKDLKSFWESYKESRLHAGGARVIGPPTSIQTKMAEARKKGTAPRMIAKLFKVDVPTVHAAIKRVAFYEFLKK